MRKINKSQRGRKGYVLAFVIGVIILLTIIGYGMMSLGFGARVMSIRQIQDTYAAKAAEAGILQALGTLNVKNAEAGSWNDSYLDTLKGTNVTLNGCEAAFDYEVTGSQAAGFTITGVGKSGNFTKTFHASTKLVSIFDYGVLTKGLIDLYAGSLASAYNSTTGQTGLEIQVATLSTNDNVVTIKNGATINGEVIVGEGGNPSDVIDNKGTITGGTGEVLDDIQFVDPVPPTLTAKGNINGTTTISQNGKYTSISLGNKQTLTVSGNVTIQVTGSVTLNNGATIDIPNGSSLTMYVEGNVDGKEGSDINNQGKPADFKLYGTNDISQTLSLKAKNDFFGVVYAPNAAIDVKAKTNINGAFIGKSFVMKAKANVNYDKALSTANINDFGVMYVIDKWWEE